MLRSLYSGISGLRNHQVAIDISANNIANVNTVGFKSGRVTFEESMSQLLKGASRPPGDAGGTNPMQVGLGMSIGSIDTLITQGNLQSTGQITDLAVEGRAYFAFSNGEGTFYSRNGALQMDSGGRLVSPTNGFSLQGMMAAYDGTYPPGSKVGDVRVPYGEKAPAKATSDVKYQCNLDSDSQGLGTVVHTNRYLANAAGTDRLSAMFDENGNSLGIKPGDILSFEVTDGITGLKYNTDVTVTDDIPNPANNEVQTLDDLTASLQGFIAGSVSNGALVGVAVNPTTGNIEVDLSGAAGVSLGNLTVRSNRPGSNSFVTSVFNWGPSITTADGIVNSAKGGRAPAEATDMLADLYDASGYALGLEDNDTISITGNIGGSTIPDVPPMTYNSATTTMQDLLEEIQRRFNLPDTDGTYLNKPSVEINLPGQSSTDDRIPLGAIVIRGQQETAFALTNVSISADNSDNDQTGPVRFVANSQMTDIQNARDTGIHSTSIKVYDESGAAHTMTTTFTHSGRPSEWLWEVTMDGGEQIISGNRGTISFGQDGSPSAFTFDDNSTNFRFNPMNGSNEVSVNMDVGGPGSLRGITQFRSPTTTAAREQDGYPMGKLSEIAIDEYGEIKGIYTNGVSKSLARIMLAEFINPAGLMKIGDSMYATSNNSGEGVLLQAGVGTPSKIKPGALEMSNVELASEFTNLITTQRGYQANARVITTSDNMLQELVQLIR